MGTFIWLDLFVSITFVGVGLLLCIIAYYSTSGLKALRTLCNMELQNDKRE